MDKEAQRYASLAGAHWHSIRRLEDCLQDPETLKTLNAYPERKLQDSTPEIIATLVVYRAFCVELYLKAIYIAEGNKHQGGHDLKSLFERLSADDQRKIKVVIGDPDFDTKLASASYEFVEWRYMDKNNLSSDTGFMSRLMDALSDRWTAYCHGTP